ELYPLTSLRSL
nr:Chain B, p6-gag [synthetic construct]